MSPCLAVLTDFFAVSNRTLSYAAGLAVPLRAHLLLVHVHHDALLAPEEFREHHTWRGELKTFYALEKLAAEQPVPTEVDISNDALADAVREVVRERDPLLLLLGRPGYEGAPPEVLTRTATRLLRHVPFPLLVVPGPGWDKFPPRRLLLAVDGHHFRLGVHQSAVQHLLAATGGTLDVVHVTDDEHARPEVATVLETIAENDLPEAPLTASQLHEVYHRDVLRGILEEAARQAADLLVVVARRHSFLGSLFHRSVTARLLQESPIPVLVLPAEE
ncbi:universal stress protein [Hymenobacter convexus]|uniref:universal stress protein n=1 Tax=Hymenobacter sp. CA1UV-4 TaxID=3063782 RepID=UPI002713490F|nr:universal stress protein [Hymenobacter sp. CA1UV-4]MDO7852472.1 universal stress protein [Hymenobacter sp. CA1UV-4]